MIARAEAIACQKLNCDNNNDKYNHYKDGWCEGGVRQQRNDGGGCATMRERPKSVESPGTYVTK